MRTRLVTRTINEVTANTVIYDVVAGEIKTVNYTLTGKMDKDVALKALKKAHETDTIKVVTVNSIDVVEQLYGMSEEEFIKVAKKIDKRYATK